MSHTPAARRVTLGRDDLAGLGVATLHRWPAGSGYDYLLRQVAAPMNSKQAVGLEESSGSRRSDLVPLPVDHAGLRRAATLGFRFAPGVWQMGGCVSPPDDWRGGPGQGRRRRCRAVGLGGDRARGLKWWGVRVVVSTFEPEAMTVRVARPSGCRRRTQLTPGDSDHTASREVLLRHGPLPGALLVVHVGIHWNCKA